MRPLEQARWISWTDPVDRDLPPGRLYLGEETCQRRMPPSESLRPWLARAARSARPVTLVTPPLSERGLTRAEELVDTAVAELGGCEVVCNDWGLLRRLGSRPGVVLAAGRLLAGQQVDPRLGRMFHADRPRRTVTHLDGTRCLLQPVLPKEALADHLRRPSLDRPLPLELLERMGARRVEVSNPVQGLEIQSAGALAWTLVLPEVLVAVRRACPLGPADLEAPCPAQADPRCCPEETWRHETIPEMVRRGNALYYRNTTLPANLDLLPVDRIVQAP